jgi:hypothetical protein
VMILKPSMVPAVAILFLATGGWFVPKASAVPAQPAAYGQEREWDIPPGEFNDIQRRGFHDGVEGARRDYGNHRNPDVDNREEYRNPDLAPDLREPYRAAFRRGYETAASHLWGTPPPPPPPPVPQPEPNRPGWEGWGMRGLQSDAERDGFREGQNEARKDFELRRRADPDDHEEFRNPRVPPALADEYREGFMRGYEVAMSQLSGEPQWQPRGDPDQWAPPERFTEMQRRGFHEGIEGARRDFGNHRRPNVANREEYRTPRVPEPYWQEYREGFRRGYEMAASQLWGGM